MDAVLEEFCRVSGTLQIHVFRRMQRYFASELGPKIDRLEAENAMLRERLEIIESAPSTAVEAAYERAEAAVTVAESAAPPKRGRGRPRKHPIEEPVAV